MNNSEFQLNSYDKPADLQELQSLLGFPDTDEVKFYVCNTVKPYVIGEHTFECQCFYWYIDPALNSHGFPAVAATLSLILERYFMPPKSIIIGVIVKKMD